MSSSPPLSTPPNPPEVQDVSNTFSPSLSKHSGAHRTEEEPYNKIGTEAEAEESIVQSHFSIDRSRTDFSISPDYSELLTLAELFAPSTNVAVPSRNLTSQVYPSNPLPSNQVNISGADEGALINGSGITEHGHDAEKQAMGSLSLGTKRARSVSSLPNSSRNDDDDNLINLVRPVPTSTSLATNPSDFSSRTTNHVRLLSPLLFDYRSLTTSESSIHNGDDESLVNLVGPTPTNTLSTITKDSDTSSRARKRVRFVSPPLLINSGSVSSACSDDNRSLINLVGHTSRKTFNLKRRETVNTKMAKKRRFFMKSQKKRLVGRSGSRALKKIKTTKGRQKHHGRISKSRKSLKDRKKIQDEDYCSSVISDDIVVPAASEGPSGHDVSHLPLIKDAFLAKVKESWDEVTAINSNRKLNLFKNGPIDKNTNNSRCPGQGYSRPCTRLAVRNHLKNLIFPDIPNNALVQIPWLTLGIWLRINKKRFINWNKTIPFAQVTSMFMARSPAWQLMKFLELDLVDWTEDEIKFGKSEVPLVVDRTGHVLVKVGDLPHLYPGYRHKLSVLDDEKSILNDQGSSNKKSRYETRSSQSFASLSSSLDSTSIISSPTKRKRRTCSSKKHHWAVVSNSDREDDSGSEDEESESDSEYETEEENMIDYTAVKGKMSKRNKQVY